MFSVVSIKGEGMAYRKYRRKRVVFVLGILPRGERSALDDGVHMGDSLVGSTSMGTLGGVEPPINPVQSLSVFKGD